MKYKKGQELIARKIYTGGQNTHVEYIKPCERLLITDIEKDGRYSVLNIDYSVAYITLSEDELEYLTT